MVYFIYDYIRIRLNIRYYILNIYYLFGCWNPYEMYYIITTIDQIWLFLFISRNENEITVFNEC